MIPIFVILNSYYEMDTVEKLAKYIKMNIKRLEFERIEIMIYQKDAKNSLSIDLGLEDDRKTPNFRVSARFDRNPPIFPTLEKAITHFEERLGKKFKMRILLNHY